MAKKKHGQKKVIEKKKEKEATSKSLKSKENKQLIWFFVIIILLFAGFLGTYFYVSSLNKFEYGGIPFEKVKMGELKLYHGRFPIIIDNVLQNYYNFWLRDNPRKNNIPINTGLMGVVLRPQVIVSGTNLKPKIIISLEPEAGNCSTSMLGQIELSKFLGAFGLFEVEGAMNDNETAEEINVPYATCKHANSKQAVIIVQKSDTPSIEQGTNENCYVINVGECENSKTVERFIVGVVAQLNRKEI